MAEPEQPRNPPDPIADSLRAAGPRPPLEAVDLEALSAPALAVWQQQVRRRRVLRRVLALAATLVVFVVALLLFRGPSQQPMMATIIAYAGERSEENTIGSELVEGRVLTTSGQPDEWLTVKMRAGHRLRLDAATALQLTSPTRVDLLYGRVYVEAEAAELRIHAGDTVSEHIGTRYEVRLDDGLAMVRVREGRVKMWKGEQSVEIQRGERAIGEEEIVVEPSLPHGTSWAWTQRATPPFLSDGTDLETFLEWVGAETGWRVDIEPSLLLDPSGQPVRVRGSVGGLPVEDALSWVLESAGLSASVEGGRLQVEEAR